MFARGRRRFSCCWNCGAATLAPNQLNNRAMVNDTFEATSTRPQRTGGVELPRGKSRPRRTFNVQRSTFSIQCSSFRLLPFFLLFLFPGLNNRAAAPPVIPVGLDAYRLWDRWPQQRIGARAYMRSTYDRRGGNEGADASHFLYQIAEDKNVTLDVQGQGVLYFAQIGRASCRERVWIVRSSDA